MSKSGLFISFEGGDGAGKTTILEKLQKDLLLHHFEVVRTREPGGSALGEQIRKWVLNHDASIQIGNQAELLLFLAGRAQHLEELIKPALQAGKIVLCDRFNDSTVAYQGFARGLGESTVQQMCDLVCGDVQPSLTIFLDIDPLEGLRRTRHAFKENADPGQLDRMESEKLDFHQRVRQGLLHLAEKHPERICKVDASQPISKVFADVWKKVLPLLATKKA
ncbi:MAG: dTMP kinase [Parachlamydiaceae bacterium]|nr:dTMP kinase [Parachlamydiaceae bacterium]